jgi:hypothetical protein
MPARRDARGAAPEGLTGAGTLQKSARNQIVFREVNERIAELTGDGNETGVSLFICECGDRACAESLEVTPSEYELVRGHGARFIVLPGHDQSEVEHVVDSCARFVVVEMDGADATVAREANPRRHDRADRS